MQEMSQSVRQNCLRSANSRQVSSAGFAQQRQGTYGLGPLGQVSGGGHSFITGTGGVSVQAPALRGKVWGFKFATS